MKNEIKMDTIHSLETAHNKAIRKMEERDTHILNKPSLKKAVDVDKQIRVQQEAFINAIQPLQDVLQSCGSLLEQNGLGITSAVASLSVATKTIVSDNMARSIADSLDDIVTTMRPYQDFFQFNSDILSTFKSAKITPELHDLHMQIEANIQSKGNGLSVISDYIKEMTLQWNDVLGISDVLERSFAAQNFAVIRLFPNYDNLQLPRGGKSALKSLTKSAAKKIIESDEIRFDPKEREFYHKDSPDNKITGNQITVVESSLAIFAKITFDDLVSFESKLEENYAFGMRHPVGIRIFDILQNWNSFVSFDDITYYHARTLKVNQRPFHDSEMMKAPINVSAHGRYNEVGRSCYYIAESKDGAIKEIYKHSGGTKPNVQVIGLRAIKEVKLLDLSEEVKGSNYFIEHMRFTVENEEGRTVKEYLLPNYVASCCKELGIDGIRYKSTGYNCVVLWKDDYFEYVEGSREIICNC